MTSDDDREKLDAEYAAQVAECSGDPESGHMLADSLLLELLAKMGFIKTVEALQRLPKWYA